MEGKGSPLGCHLVTPGRTSLQLGTASLPQSSGTSLPRSTLFLVVSAHVMFWTSFLSLDLLICVSPAYMALVVLS